MLCKLCEGSIPVPEGESVLHVCTDCLKLKDLTGNDLKTQVRARETAKLAKVKVYKAENVPEKPIADYPEGNWDDHVVVEKPKASIAKDAVAAVKKAPKKAPRKKATVKRGKAKK